MCDARAAERADGASPPPLDPLPLSVTKSQQRGDNGEKLLSKQQRLQDHREQQQQHGPRSSSSSSSTTRLGSKPKSVHECLKCSARSCAVVHSGGTIGYCRDCFLTMIAGKFRKRLGQGRVLASRLGRDIRRVGVAYSGGAASGALLTLLDDGLAGRGAHRQLRIKPVILHVNEMAIAEYAGGGASAAASACHAWYARVRAQAQKTGFPWHETPIESTFAEGTLSSSRVAAAAAAAAAAASAVSTANARGVSGPRARLWAALDATTTLTARTDILMSLRRAALESLARDAGCDMVLLGDCSTLLANRFLSHIALGRGVQVADDTAYHDTGDGMGGGLALNDCSGKGKKGKRHQVSTAATASVDAAAEDSSTSKGGGEGSAASGPDKTTTTSENDVNVFAAADNSITNVSWVRPLMALARQDLVLFCHWRGVDIVAIPGVDTLTPARASIQRLTEEFVSTLSADFPSTVPNVVRTAAKVVSGTVTGGSDVKLAIQGSSGKGSKKVDAAKSASSTVTGTTCTQEGAKSSKEPPIRSSNSSNSSSSSSSSSRKPLHPSFRPRCVLCGGLKETARLESGAGSISGPGPLLDIPAPRHRGAGSCGSGASSCSAAAAGVGCGGAGGGSCDGGVDGVVSAGPTGTGDCGGDQCCSNNNGKGGCASANDASTVIANGGADVVVAAAATATVDADAASTPPTHSKLTTTALTLDVDDSLCHGCRRTLADQKPNAIILPAFVGNQARREVAREQMRADIAEFLLSDSEVEEDVADLIDSR